MDTKITVDMAPVNAIIRKLGVDSRGEVQKQVTANINRRMTRYMPHRTGVMSTKLKFIKSPTEIEVLGPYARYQYYGKVMVDPVTRAAGFMTKDGWKSRRGVPKVLTDRDLKYTKTNPLAGPFWDKRMMAAEGKKIVAETQAYVDRRAKK